MSAETTARGGVGESIRGEFPILEHATYLNSCSQGALSHRVRAAYEEYLAGWDENGAEWEFWVERAEAARAGFAALLHGEPDEVAGAAVFLASAAGNFVTGQTLVIDGGITAGSVTSH